MNCAIWKVQNENRFIFKIENKSIGNFQRESTICNKFLQKQLQSQLSTLSGTEIDVYYIFKKQTHGKRHQVLLQIHEIALTISS